MNTLKPRVHTRHDNMKARSQWNTQAVFHIGQDITWIHMNTSMNTTWIHQLVTGDPLCHGPVGVPRLATRCLCVLSTWLVVGAMCSHVDCLSPPILLLNHCFSGSSCVSLVTLVCLIVSVAPAVSPSLPSFVSLYNTWCYWHFLFMFASSRLIALCTPQL